MGEAPGAVDVGALAALIHEAAERHHQFEQEAPEHDWWDWYAPYVQARLQGDDPGEAVTAADRYMKDVLGIERR